MQRATLKRRAAMWPAEILDRIADEGTWRTDGATLTVHSHRVEGLDLTASTPLSDNGVPTAAQRFLGTEPQLIQRLRSAPVADTAAVASLNIDAEIPGAPLEVHVEITMLRQDDNFTDVLAVIETVCSLPLVGKAIESGAQPHIKDMISVSLDRLSDL
ncbi:MAG: DUF2505 family protein [Brevibacterium aurantiacum]|uniref:DUF2505 family protein n=1 Tax=Brevibacterium aurantiacum TaxID=273384 RepID=UPI003F9272F0